jgi:DNA-binding SARP family transcriptional activator
MGGLHVELFGRFRVSRDAMPVDGLDARRVQELLAYLLLNRRRPQPRETLAELLWADGPALQARKYLRQALWQLQHALDPAPRPDVTPVLAVDSDWIAIDGRADVRLDVAVFEQAYLRVKDVPGAALDRAQADELEAAVALYRGDLLDGWYADWCLAERERLQNLYLIMLDKLMVEAEARAAYERGLDFGARILRTERAHERTHRRMMHLHCLLGDRTAALRQFERCATALREDFGVAPDARTIALGERIRNDRGIPFASPGHPGSAPRLTEPSPASRTAPSGSGGPGNRSPAHEPGNAGTSATAQQPLSSARILSHLDDLAALVDAMRQYVDPDAAPGGARGEHAHPAEKPAPRRTPA